MTVNPSSIMAETVEPEVQDCIITLDQVTKHYIMGRNVVKALDGERVLAEAPLAVDWGRACELRLRVQGVRLTAYVDGRLLFELADTGNPLTSGGIALVVREGTLTTEAVAARPIGS